MAKILDGRIVRDEIKSELIKRVSRLGFSPCLTVVQVGNLPASTSYIGQKIKFGEAIGVKVKHLCFSNNISLDELKNEILKLNQDNSVRGIIVQLPLPPQLDVWEVIETIDPKKDVDGLTAINLKKLWARQSTLIPATARGVLTLLDYYKIVIAGKRVVVVGRSNLVGGPIALAMLNRGATVTVCHRQTKDLASITKTAEILISATGHPGLITSAEVSPRQVVIDVGLTVSTGGGLVGDVAYAEVAKTVSAITPVPGGVGPMTVCSLFMNLLDVCENLKK
ncbi:MAG: bifunctional 5,10-methylenetetrahydrofolate dehydrogenase/5,10-methenyltetrahydrofolate cyclohydrolase [Patescibacteria group bacterium]